MMPVRHLERRTDISEVKNLAERTDTDEDMLRYLANQIGDGGLESSLQF